MLRGERHPSVNIGPAEMQKELGELLKSRAGILDTWAADDEMW
jgi:hypothetical protein